ncbi:MAG: zinc-ribbon domain-containing protein [Dehalococcoidales bacterium]|nr:zinc-ribbon domain-containing protein [Dehalococcoidales bacterium]
MFEMFFFLIGSKGYKDRLGYIATTCPECRMRGLFTVEQERKKFTLYLVPTFEYSKKQFMSCPYCREVFEVADEIKSQLAAKLISQEQLTAIIRNGQLEKLLTKHISKQKMIDNTSD